MKSLWLLMSMLGAAGAGAAQSPVPVKATLFHNYWSEEVPQAAAAYRVQRLETPGQVRLDSVFATASNRLLRVSRTLWPTTGSDTLTTTITTRWRANGALFVVHSELGSQWHGTYNCFDGAGRLKRTTVYERGRELSSQCYDETGTARPCTGAEYSEQMPTFPGGMNGMLAYLGRSIRYPAAALKTGKQGKVLVEFYVTETGDIRDIRLKQSVSAALDAEALRVIEAMPRWEPGVQDGERVPVRYTVPITFAIR
ncbi:energy transducer TonB [Hymenobacter elongatus]|uniref:Energy transducer TonB n=1 Tax=Hymenobacter elongatus TaxID=877208 RepID=A0A4Z0PGN2_9BACT|nr:energy transducer TonB [Hymenobacter elongatus]TGE13944.1 energy transducer TonB [Hymenobacter elongatus]